MTIITISRESGARGSRIGQQLAEQLGYRYIGRDAIHEVCKEYGIRQDEYEHLYEHAPGFFERYDKRNREIVKLIAYIIRGLAHRDNAVIVSRDSFDALRGFDDVLHVRVTADANLRAVRIQDEHGIKLEEAQAMLNRLDNERGKYISVFHGQNWNDAALYDISVNTSKLTVMQATALVLQALEYLKENDSPDGLHIDSIETDLIIENAIDEALDFLDATAVSE